MILDVYPSSKDTEMVDLLYEFERDTRLSLNILVENYLEKLLYDEGYLPKNSNGIKDTQSNDKMIVTRDSFTIKSEGHSKSIHFHDLHFGFHNLQNVEWVVDELSKLPYETLEEISNNNWDKKNGKYSFFLRKKLKNPSLTIKRFVREKQFRFIYVVSKDATQLKRTENNFSFGSFKGKDTPEIKKAMNYFMNAPIEEINELQKKILNEKGNRRQITLKWISEKEDK